MMSRSSSATSLHDAGPSQDQYTINPMLDSNVGGGGGRFSKTRAALHQDTRRPLLVSNTVSSNQLPGALPRLGGATSVMNSSQQSGSSAVVGAASSVVATTPVRRRLLPDMNTSFTEPLDSHNTSNHTHLQQHQQLPSQIPQTTTTMLATTQSVNNNSAHDDDDDDDQPRLGSVAPSTVNTTGRASSCQTAQSSERPSGGGGALTTSTDPYHHSTELAVPPSISSMMPVVEPIRPTKIRPQPRRAAPSPPMAPTQLLHVPQSSASITQQQRAHTNNMRMASPQSEVSSVNCVSLESSYSRDSIPPPEPSPKPPTRQPSPPVSYHHPLHQPSAVRPSQENTPTKTTTPQQHATTTAGGGGGVDVGGITPNKDSAFYHPSTTTSLMGPRRPTQQHESAPHHNTPHSIAPRGDEVLAPHDPITTTASTTAPIRYSSTNRRNNVTAPPSHNNNTSSISSVMDNSSVVVGARRGPIHSPFAAHSIPSPSMEEEVSVNTSLSLRRGLTIRSPATAMDTDGQFIPTLSSSTTHRDTYGFHGHHTRSSGLLGPSGEDGGVVDVNHTHGADTAHNRSGRGGLIAPPCDEEEGSGTKDDGASTNMTTPSLPLLPSVPDIMSPANVVIRSPRRELQSPRSEQCTHTGEIVNTPVKSKEEGEEENSPLPTNPSSVPPTTEAASPPLAHQPFERPPPSTHTHPTATTPEVGDDRSGALIAVAPTSERQESNRQSIIASPALTDDNDHHQPISAPTIDDDNLYPNYPPIGGPSIARSQQSICSPPEEEDDAPTATTPDEEVVVPQIKTLPSDDTTAIQDVVVDSRHHHTAVDLRDSEPQSQHDAAEVVDEVTLLKMHKDDAEAADADDTTPRREEDISTAGGVGVEVDNDNSHHHQHIVHSDDVSLEGEDVMRRILGLHNDPEKEEDEPSSHRPSTSQQHSEGSKSAITTDDAPAEGDDDAPPPVRVTRTRSQLLQEVLAQARRRLDSNNVEGPGKEMGGGGSRRSSITTSPPPVAPTITTQDSAGGNDHNSNPSSRFTTPSRISNDRLGGNPSMLVVAPSQRHHIDLSVLTQPEEDGGDGSHASWHQDGSMLTKLPKRPPSSYFSPAPTNTPCHRELRDQRRRQHEYHDLVSNPYNVSSIVTMVGNTTATPFATRNNRVVPLFEQLEEERRALELQQVGHPNNNNNTNTSAVYEDPLFHGAAPYTYSVSALEARRRYYTPNTTGEDTDVPPNIHAADVTDSQHDKKGHSSVEKKSKSDKKRRKERSSSTKRKEKREKKEKRRRRSNDRKAINDASTAAIYLDTTNNATNNDANYTNNNAATTSRDKSPSPNFSTFNNHINTRKSESYFPDAGNPRGTTKTEMFDDPSSFAHFHPDTFPADTKHLGGSFASFGGTTPTDQAISEIAGSGASDVFDATYKGMENVVGQQRQQQRGVGGGNNTTNNTANNNNTNNTPDTNDVASWLRSTDGAAAAVDDDLCSEEDDDFSQSVSSSGGEAKPRSGGGRKAEKHRHYHRGGITEQARKAMEQTLAETAARERQAAKDRRPLHSSTNTGSLGASANPVGAMTPMMGSNVPRIGFDMKGHEIREVKRTGPGVGGGQGSLFSSVAVPVGGGFSASQDALPNQNAQPTTTLPAAAVSSSVDQGGLGSGEEPAAVVSSSLADVNDDVAKSETTHKDASEVTGDGVTPTTTTTPAQGDEQGPFSNNSERGSCVPGASVKESGTHTSSSSTLSDDDDSSSTTSSSDSSSSSSNSSSHGAATTVSRTSSTAIRALGDTQVPPRSNASASKDGVKPSSPSSKKKRKSKQLKSDTATAPPSPQSPQEVAARRASSVGGGKRVLALSKQTVLGVLSGKTTIDDATATMPPAARKAATIMLTALRKKQLEANKKKKEAADVEEAAAKSVKKTQSSSTTGGEDTNKKEKGTRPSSRRTSHASTLKPGTNTRPQSRRNSVAFSPDKYSESSAAAAAMHHYHTPWATVEERRSSSPNSTRHHHHPSSSSNNNNAMSAPIVTRNLRYSATPTSLPSSSYNGSSYPPYNSIPAEVVSPGYHRQSSSPSSSVPNSGHYQLHRTSGGGGVMHPATSSSSLLGNNGYYFGTPSLTTTTTSTDPHLYRNGVPYVDLEHILTTADPLMVLDANEYLSEDVIAASESRMTDRDIMRRKEEELYEADMMGEFDNNNINADSSGDQDSIVVRGGGGLWGPHTGVSSPRTINSSRRSSVHASERQQPTNMSVGGGSTYGGASSPLAGRTSSMVEVPSLQYRQQLPQHPYFPHALDLTPMRNGSRRDSDGNNGDGMDDGADELNPVDVTPLLPTSFKRHPPPKPNVPNMEMETSERQRVNTRNHAAAVEEAHRAILENQLREEEAVRLEEASRVPITLQWHSCSQGSVPSPWTASPSIKLEHEV